MTEFTLLVVIVIFIIIIINISSIKQTLNKLSIDLQMLKIDIQKINSQPPKPKEETNQEKVIVSEEPVKPKETVEQDIHDKYKPKEETLIEEIPTHIGNFEIITEKIEEPVKPIIPEQEPVYVLQPEPEPEKIQIKAQPTTVHEETFRFQTHAPKEKGDLEKFIGENLMSKIGIVILVLGIAYFVKYAIDKDWIGEYGRAAIGVILGGALIGVAHYMRKNYATFSAILTGGGIAVLYLTISIAFHQYHIFNQATAFIILCLITALSVFLSLVYDRKELAIFSQLGGFAAPFMISTGAGNYIVLFSYLIILNIGLISLAYYKKWHIVNILGFIVTVILFSSWVTKTFIYGSNPPYGNALIFGSLFYLIFFVLSILNNIKNRKAFNGVEIGMILSNNLFFFFTGMAILNDFHMGAFRGLFTVAMGCFNFGWVFFLYKRKDVDKTLIYLLIGLVLSLISLAVPIQLNGHSITLFWSAEMIILLWLWQKSRIPILKTGNFILLFLVIISLLMDWQKFYLSDYYTYTFPILINRVFITGLVIICSLSLAKFLLRKETDESYLRNLITVKQYTTLLTVMLFVGTYFIFYLELWYQMNNYFVDFAFRQTVYALYNFSFLAIGLLITKKMNMTLANQTLSYIVFLALFVFLVFYLPQIVKMRNAIISATLPVNINYSIHYLVYLPIVWLLFSLGRQRDKLFDKQSSVPTFVLWFLVIFSIITLSVEMDNIVLMMQNIPVSYETQYSVLKQVHKIGYPILWGVCAFILMITGMKFSNTTFRIQAICLLSVIILKLVLLDVWNMSEGGRIATFIFLGVLLLIISFLYQKLKKIILSNLEDQPKPDIE